MIYGIDYENLINYIKKFNDFDYMIDHIINWLDNNNIKYDKNDLIKITIIIINIDNHIKSHIELHNNLLSSNKLEPGFVIHFPVDILSTIVFTNIGDPGRSVIK